MNAKSMIFSPLKGVFEIKNIVIKKEFYRAYFNKAVNYI